MATDSEGRQPERREDDTGLGATYRKWSSAVDAVWRMIAAALVGTGVGYWLDKKLGTSPWALIVGAVLGVVTGMVILIRAAGGPSRKGRS